MKLQPSNENKRIVTQLPLLNLWKGNKDFPAKKETYLTTALIKEMLKKHPVEFVIADIGRELKWINHNKSLDFWKTEIKPHLAKDIDSIDLDNFPDNYAYIASEWKGQNHAIVILLEKFH